jgi:transposase
MLTSIGEEQWGQRSSLFGRVCPRRGEKGRDDRRFLEALHCFTTPNITWRALPAQFGLWNSVWERFCRLSLSGTFEALSGSWRACSQTAHLIQMFTEHVHPRPKLRASGFPDFVKVRGLIKCSTRTDASGAGHPMDGFWWNDCCSCPRKRPVLRRSPGISAFRAFLMKKAFRTVENERRINQSGKPENRKAACSMGPS